MNKDIFNIEPYLPNLKKFDSDYFLRSKLSNPNYHQLQFEKNLQSFLKTDKKICLTNSGTAAIHLSLIQSGVTKGDVVICSTSSFIASVNPILYVGAIPYFVDTELETGNIHPLYLEKAIKDCLAKQLKVKAVIITHSYGVPVDIIPILNLKNKYKFILIEDAADALGSRYNDSFCGTLCDYGILSFNVNKINTTLGGGALIVNDEVEKNKILKLANQNKIDSLGFKHSDLGYNYRMNDLAAYFGDLQLKSVSNEIQLKKRLYNTYKESFSTLDICSLFPVERKNGLTPNRWMNCLLFKERKVKEIVEKLLIKNNIEVRSLWYPLHLQEYLKKYLYIGNNESQYIYENGFCLPSSVTMDQESIDMIISLIKLD